MKRKLAVLIFLMIFLSGCAGLGKLEQTGAATGLPDWSTGSVFTAAQANVLKNAIDDNYALILAVEADLAGTGSDLLELQANLATAVSVLQSSIALKQDILPVGTNADVIAGTSTTASVWNAYQLYLAAITHSEGGGGGTSGPGGWDYTPQTEIPTGLVAGQVYMVDITAWNPLDALGAIDYLVFYNGTTFLPMWTSVGGPVVLDSAPSSPVTGWYYWAQSGGGWDPDVSVPGSDVYQVMYTGAGYVTIQGLDGTLYVNEGAPVDLNWAILNPAPGDAFYIKINGALTLTSIGAIIDPGGSGSYVDMDIYECDSNAANCTTILDSGLSAGHTPSAGTLVDTSIAEGVFVKVEIDSVTGTVNTLLIYGYARGEY